MVSEIVMHRIARLLIALGSVLGLACNEPTPAATRTTADASVGADAAQSAEVAADAATAGDLADAGKPDVTATDSAQDSAAPADAPTDAPAVPDGAVDAAADAPAEVAATADIAGEVAVAEVAVAEVAAGDSAGTGDAGCAPCAINCICKKDKNGCPIPECEPSTCAELTGKLDAEIAKMQTCTAAKGCQVFEYPYCGSAGCYQKPIAAGSDVAKLEPIAEAATKAQCSSFSCGCAPPKPAFCLDGSCKQCPPDCKGSCDDIKTAIATLAKQQASYCGKDEDCTVMVTGLCPFADLPCGGMALAKNADQTQLKALVEAYFPACGGGVCKCMPPKAAVCDKGKCVVPQ